MGLSLLALAAAPALAQAYPPVPGEPGPPGPPGPPGAPGAPGETTVIVKDRVKHMDRDVRPAARRVSGLPTTGADPLVALLAAGGLFVAGSSSVLVARRRNRAIA
ncbi:MAG TPA: LPXTG cell wall anchor domain-containing protein [Egibacteraceae bacterium]|nr:LPXTG cell wall anchor domain-containing protein [Egibacteraceae bacterium]